MKIEANSRVSAFRKTRKRCALYFFFLFLFSSSSFFFSFYFTARARSYLGEGVDDGRLQAVLAALPKQREQHSPGRYALLLRLQLQLPSLQLQSCDRARSTYIRDTGKAEYDNKR